MTESLLAWPIDTAHTTPLVNQISDYCREQITLCLWPAGTRLPSIRKLAKQYGISTFTVHDAYERLCAEGWIQSRQGAGYFVARRDTSQGNREESSSESELAGQVALIRSTLMQETDMLRPGCGWLPDDWLADDELRKGFRDIARQPTPLTRYGIPQGYLPLRQQLAIKLAGLNIQTSPASILLTASAGHALDLLLRHLVRPGDVVLVDDPGFFNFHASLRLAGARLIGVSKEHDQIDTAALEDIMKTQRPRLYLTNSALSNPLGVNLSLHTAHRILSLAETYGCLIIEDDIYADLQATPSPRLAALDNGHHVIYVGSFTKTLSANVRCGFIMASPPHIAALTDIKLITGMTTSEMTEQLIYRLLTGGQYKRHLNTLHRRIDQARESMLAFLSSHGYTLSVLPEGGYQAWVTLPEHVSITQFESQAKARGLLFAMGKHFYIDQRDSRNIRLNMAQSQHPRVLAYLEHLALP